MYTCLPYSTVGQDYTNVVESLVFTPGGPNRLCVDLVINDDQIGEESETLTLTLSTGPSATVTITDNGRDSPVISCNVSHFLIPHSQILW